MIRNLVLFALVAIIFYCAVVGASRAGNPVRPGDRAHAIAAASRADMRVRHQFIPGTMAALHTVARTLVVLRSATIEPSA